MKTIIILLAVLVSQAPAQRRTPRAQLGNLGSSQRIALPNLGFAQSFLPPNAKNVEIKITRTAPKSFGYSSQDSIASASGDGNNFGFSSLGGFSSHGDSSSTSTNGIGGSFGLSSHGGSKGSSGSAEGYDFSSHGGSTNGVNGKFDFSSPVENRNVESGINLDSVNFFDKNLHEPGEHISPYPIIPANIPAESSFSHQSNSQQFGSFPDTFQGHSGTTLPQTSVPQPFNHHTHAATVPTTATTPQYFGFSGNAPAVPAVNDLVQPQPGHDQHFVPHTPAPNNPVIPQHFNASAHVPTVPVHDFVQHQSQSFESNVSPINRDQIGNRHEISVDHPEVPILSGQSLEETLQQEWDSFRTKFNKVYATEGEANYRREVFIENRAKIMRFNMEYAEGKRNYVHKINEFADLLLHEFSNNFNGFNRSRRAPTVPIKPASAFVPSANVVFPDSVDWRMVGAVGPVRSQGKCAACWAFAAAGALEGHHFRKTGNLVEVSVQNLIDCTEPHGNNGCAGGLMDPAFEYVRDNNGVDSEQSYPFEERNGECRFKREDVVATCTGFVDIGENDEKGLEIALATLGPVTAAIDAGQETFQFYSEGIYDDPNCGNKPEQMNHAVLIVGFGQEADGRKYWLVKNSYGPNWGIGGYIKLAKENNNQCGIAIQASYPLV